MGNFMRLIKSAKAMAVLTCLALTLGLLAGCGAGTADAPEDQGVLALHVEKGKLKDANGDSVQLRGFSTHGLTWFPQYVNANAFSAIKEAGGNVVRAAMYTDTNDGYVAKPEQNLLLVRQAVENAIALDMYVIVDWHILSDGDPNTHLTQAITFFDAVASAYGDTPNIIYEVCNEPNGTGWEEVSAYAYSIIPVIRQYAPNAVILIGTPGFSSQIRSATEMPVEAENLMYAFHYYAGEHYSYDALKEAVEKDTPVFVSEWGVGTSAQTGEPAVSEGREFAEWMNKKGISWCAWSLCNKDEVYSALKPDCYKWGGFTAEDFTEGGAMLFEELKG